MSDGPGERGVEASVPFDGLGVKSGEGAGRDRRGGREKEEGERETLGWPNGTPPSAPVSPRPPQGEAHSAPSTDSRQTQSLQSQPPAPGPSGTQPHHTPEARVRLQDDVVGTDLGVHQARPATSSRTPPRVGPPRGRGPHPAPRGKPGAPVRVQQWGLGCLTHPRPSGAHCC